MKPISLRVVVLREAGWWVAQCLEYDLAAQGKTLRDTLYEFQRMVFGHIAACHENNLQPFVWLPPAPQKYSDLFNAALELKDRGERFQLPSDVPPAWMLPIEREVRVSA